MIDVIGVGVLVLREGRVLLGQRLGVHGAEQWAPPGGHLEAFESVDGCVRRELFEETGLVVRSWSPGPWSVNEFPERQRRYATLFAVALVLDGAPTVREPEKCRAWHWFTWDALPAPLFAPLASLVGSGFRPQWNEDEPGR